MTASGHGRVRWDGDGSAGTLSGMNRLFLLALAVLAVHVIDDSFVAPRRGTTAGRPSRQRAGAARRARARRVGVPAPAARRARRARARARRARARRERRGGALRRRRGRLHRASRRSRPGSLLLGIGVDHALALAPPRRLEATCAARCSASPACSSSCSPCSRSAWPTSRSTWRATPCRAPQPRRAARGRDADDERRAQAQGLVRPVAQRRRRDRLPGPQGPAAARADAGPPRLRRAAARPPRRGRERGRPDDPWGWGGARDLHGRRRVPAAPPGRRAPAASAGSGCRSAAR